MRLFTVVRVNVVGVRWPSGLFLQDDVSISLRVETQAKQLRNTAGQSYRTSTNGQFLARSSPLQAVSQEKDSAGQSFVARGPPACFAQPRAASAKLAPIQAAYMSSCASARTSCVARGRKRLRRAKLRGPRATCMLRPAPGRLS